MTRATIEPALRRRSLLLGGTSTLLCWGAGCSDGPGESGTNGSSSSSGSSTTTSSDASSSTQGSGSATAAPTDGSSSSGTTVTGTDTSNAGSSGISVDSSSESGSTGEPFECDGRAYLAGGTVSMAGDYPSPFKADPKTCPPLSPQTCGPCYAVGAVRQDVSNGLVGLPTRLNFKLLQQGTCDPVVGAIVDIWFTNVDGEYSDVTPSNICNNDNPAVLAEDFMRGQQTTDVAGEVEFDGVFPGWYPIRTAHLHVLVIIEGTRHYATQLYFDDDLAEGIYQTHPDYNHRPNRKVDNAMDGGFNPANVMNTQRTYDCALQAWATIAIPNVSTDPNC